jgi:1-aminocyclopropane-1-carboxylate deaminase/D-cysteine desulfhydrase-like pyridoxal-dependent ACC family enzyme
MSISSFERHPLLFGPSPVHPLERLSAHLGGAPVWAKREDCNSGIAYGGNKTRKLEYLVADALAKGCDTLVSIGGVQSNHTRQVAAVAARAGMRCVLIQESWVTGRTRSTTRSATSDQPAGRGGRAAGARRVRHWIQEELGALLIRTEDWW